MLAGSQHTPALLASLGLTQIPHLPAFPGVHILDRYSCPPQASRNSSCALTCLPPCTQQLVSEKVGGAEGTKLDDDFREMEKVGFHTGLWWGLLLLEDRRAYIQLHLHL